MDLSEFLNSGGVYDKAVPIVTQQELKEFHRIDRVLYARLVMDLGRDLDESVRVVAMCLFLERSNYAHTMVQIMAESTDYFVNSLANELVLCMQCIDKDPADPFLTRSVQEIPLLTSITNRQVSLRYFVENRDLVIKELLRIMTEVCYRAFDDLYRTAVVGRMVAAQPQPPPPTPMTRGMYHGPNSSGSWNMQRYEDASIREQLEREPPRGYMAMLLGLDGDTNIDDMEFNVRMVNLQTDTPNTSNSTGAGGRGN